MGIWKIFFTLSKKIFIMHSFDWYKKRELTRAHSVSTKTTPERHQAMKED